jgi:magnesium transporter
MARARKPRKPDPLKRVLAALAAGEPAGLRVVLASQHPADIATALEGLPPEQRPAVWAEIDIERMGEVLLELPEAVRTDMVKLMDERALVAAARALDTDDIADLIPELSDEVIAEILFALDKQDRQRLDAVLPYPEDTAGGLMNVDAVTVRENLTIEVVLRYLRRRGELPEHTNSLFVVDRHDVLVGVLSVSRLLTAELSARVSRLMEREVIKFPAFASDKEVAAAFERYNLLSAPVVDENNRLLGRITVDDVVDVIRSQAERAVLAPAGLTEEQDIFAPVARTSRQRGIWLGVNLLTAVLASAVIGLFEDTIQQVVALAVLMPIVASMGGNAGTQTLTVVVRGLALGVVTEANARRVLTKELMVGALNGLLWAVVVAVVALWWYKSLVIGLLIASAMVINLAFAALSGVTIPILVRKLGVDPALASSVILTTVTDVVGFFAFLGLATLYLV